MLLPTIPLALFSLLTTVLAGPILNFETRQARTAKLTFYGANYKDSYNIDVADGQVVKISTPTTPSIPTYPHTSPMSTFPRHAFSEGPCFGSTSP